MLTHISVFGREKLTPGESGITLALKLPSVQQEAGKEVIIELAYGGGENPGMRFREVASGYYKPERSVSTSRADLSLLPGQVSWQIS